MTTTDYPTAVIPLKGSPVAPAASSTTTAATLRSLYNRAARAFLHRDIEQTHALIASAFSLLHPPPGPAPDALAEHRRKWDVLRITLDTTVYAAPAADDKAVPAALRDTRALPAAALIQALHDRSLALFTPAAHAPRKPSAAFLPSQVLITLVLSSMKLDCPDAGRTLIEDWLAKRGQFEEPQDGEGYEKVLDMYCLHVLPRLEEWDYAKEFLQYEGELPADKRNALASSLQTLHTETLDARRPPSPPRTPTPTPAHPAALRAVSPAPSASSSSSSLSTTSTHTIVPRTSRSGAPNGLSHLAPSLSSASLASDITVKHAPASPRPPAPRSRSLSSTVSTSSVPRPPRAPAHPAAVRAPTTLALLRAALPILGARAYTFALLCVLLPLVSLVLRIRRRQGAVGGAGGVGAADAVRRRLAAAGAGAGVVGRVWGEVVRAVGDTVRMGGGGLV
ncbi:hypothetical protein HWV62_11305 [Athelia sp. TMB]|nr:hypothetical protein HWV62_11305 [Athelia sp. TMB]